ncbi:uncharacterized protein LOC111911131 isoform X2 [Lactuca sativa]|uniref:AT3G52170-like helix-turn-helix domain-containing protein n=1 Tax=Lactuca sativa TaxID=4236 RepID=A0A9R1UWC8_LACSA|nr:uncharacterized protein LOC111911131 isoform X2 [Lactuca sativa]KAJ0194474.1 hypothetical protein LSAT_V11C800397850 [Lactuca sativa]
MHVSRGGWVGPTFALAKFDDSFEGKKSVIRRSKEERKGMVETFIKRYQKSNNGDFPSLNLTRKEVGGSFYTVREIVREIIQENRVLGPPKSTPGDKNMEKLDSFLEHNPLGSMSVDLHVHMVTQEGSIVDDQKDGLVTNQSEKHEISEDIVVGASSSSSSSLGHVTMEEKDTENREVVDIQLEEENHKNQNHTSTEENIDVKLEDSLPVEEKNVNGAYTPNLHTISVQELTLEDDDERNANLIKSSDHSSSQKRRTTATLNRINLESWEAASKKSSGQETHRFVTFIKAFITAFVKFWSDD